MADPAPSGSSGVNWVGVALGGLLLALVVATIDETVIRVAAAVAVLAVTFYLAQLHEERPIENPIFEQLHKGAGGGGLDRRKYGKLRAFTDRMLDDVRSMNRIAIDAREGKISQRFAQGEMERISDQMRSLISEIRKSAGVPTPIEEAPPAPRRIVTPHRGSSGSSVGSGGAAGSSEKPDSREKPSNDS